MTGRKRTQPMVDIGDGIKIPETAEGYVTFPEAGCEVRGTAVYDPGTGRYRVRKVEVTALDDGEVSGTMLRDVRMAEVVRDAARRAVHDRLVGVLFTPPAKFMREALTGPTTETLTLVALVYRLALLVGDAPTQAVTEQLGVPRSTAARWVTRARDRGLLTVVDPRAARPDTDGKDDR